MTRRYLRRHLTPGVLAEQQRAYGTTSTVPEEQGADELGEKERQFIAARDSFYIASLTEDGAPYLQHRGGPPGFLQVVEARTLEFADFSGNRQLLTTAHVRRDPRVALFLMDYPNRRRLKIDGLAEVRPAPPGAVAGAVAGAAATPVERRLRIRVLAFDWNCPQFITPRYSEAELEARVAERQQGLQR
ncbi:pyridoxamine 5'-phosphate oxidase family protein [Cyanobium sp. NIES-981]|uniref:pyridoxamine 5'-phosphate oxidase family protein n=1 Tax=Cyanobium sp. NIES-981 TaxID=1851505 RepID=UPI0007DD6E6C|nr:pyridoxamine 5'-phosphate oxidase family protein [Cyanobium sp. NIES-981]SBO43370.1 Pyridoxamine 5'-phosphate oxidase-related, FMN binding protein [Cyanobium sp. NIES-981]